jgi:hypothetical protein
MMMRCNLRGNLPCCMGIGTACAWFPSICSGPWICEVGLDAVLPVPDACRDWDRAIGMIGSGWYSRWFAVCLKRGLIRGFNRHSCLSLGGYSCFLGSAKRNGRSLSFGCSLFPLPFHSTGRTGSLSFRTFDFHPPRFPRGYQTQELNLHSSRHASIHSFIIHLNKNRPK